MKIDWEGYRWFIEFTAYLVIACVLAKPLAVGLFLGSIAVLLLTRIACALESVNAKLG